MTAKRWLLINSFLISLILNLSLFLIPLLYREHPAPQSMEKMNVEFVSLPSARILERRSPGVQRDHLSPSSPGYSQSTTKYVSVTRYVSIVREMASASRDSAVSTVADLTSRFDSATLPSMKLDRGNGTAPVASGFSAIRSSTSRSSGGQAARPGGAIQPHQPMATIMGAGKNLNGYYNISLVRYEDSSDNVSTDALTQLAGAMNRWTQIRTKVIREPMMLDDPVLVRVPLIYIASRRPFAFSERERESLRKYFASGGFMIFSNAAVSDAESRGVANSIGFELWKLLGESAHSLVNIDREHQIYTGFFPLQKSRASDLLGIPLNDRIVIIYEDSGYGSAWAAGKDSDREPYLRMGVNIIAYALTTSPLVTRAR